MNRLLTRARAGDREAEEQLFEVLRIRFLNIAKRRVGVEEDAEDVVQETCMTVLAKYKTAEFRKGFQAWAYTVLRMKIGNYFQRRDVRRNMHIEGPVLDAKSESAGLETIRNLESALKNCLRKLAKAHPRYARALSLSYQGYRADEISSRLGITRPSLYSLLSSSRSMLSRCLETGRV